MSAAKKNETTLQDVIARASEIVSKISGNKLGQKQSFMVETRLKKRMLDLKINDPGLYLDYLNSHLESESGHLVSLLTTHHTFFFREFTHFEFLQKELANIVSDVKARGESCLRVWSAACSRGQEVYSLSMFLKYSLPLIDPNMKYEIWGSDIDPQSVKFAQNGVYHRNEIKEIPMNFLGSNWAKGTGAISEFVKAKDTIAAPCEFFVANLLNFPDNLKGKKFDIIFCRNVLIYFEREQIEQIAKSLKTYLTETGYLFSGVSESLSSFDLGLKSAGPSIYTSPRKEVEIAPEPSTSETISDRIPSTKQEVKVAPQKISIPNPMKVVCVDDSNSILVLLKKIFSEGDFEVVGVAKNGKEAEELMKTTKADVMTLDIHMPEMTGVEYLQKNFNAKHIPVVMISSVSRDDSGLAMDALSAGASDFIEKPALNNLEERGEEIKAKLKMAYLSSQMSRQSGVVSSVDKEFCKKIEVEKLDKSIRIAFGSYSNIDKVAAFVKELQSEEPPLVVFFEGQDNLLAAIQDSLGKKGISNVEILDEYKVLQKNTVYLADSAKLFDSVYENEKNKKCSVSVFGECSRTVSDKILKWSNCNLVVEDTGIEFTGLMEVAHDVVPTTSFYYLSTLFLGGE